MKHKLFYLLLLPFLFCACSDDDFSIDDNGSDTRGPWRVTLAEGMDTTLTYHAQYGILSVRIDGRTEADGEVLVSTENDWFALDRETLPDDNLVCYNCEENTDRQRQLTLRFTAANNPSHYGIITLTQISPNDVDDNEDLTPYDYVGYGYNVYQAAFDKQAICQKEPILETTAIREYYYGQDVVQRSRLAASSTDIVSTYSLHEYSTTLTENASNSKLTGAKQDCSSIQAALQAGKKIDEQNIGRGSVCKIVGAQTIDEGFLKRQIATTSDRPYSEKFEKALNLVLNEHRKGNIARRDTIIRSMLCSFGTHVIMQAFVGGRLEYSFTLDKELPGGVNELIDEEIRFAFGTSMTTSTASERKAVTSNKSAGFKVIGGSDAARKAMEDSIKNLDSSSRIAPQTMTDWLASIDYNDNSTLDIVKFKLAPIWDFVPQELRTPFMNEVLDMANSSSFKIDDKYTGTDIYELDLGSNVTSFSDNDANESLCRIIYNGETPIAEICSEYVPKIRTDKRVVVVYPIFNQKIRMNQGIFLGDGVHKPAYVGFSDSISYVASIDSLANTTVLNRITYLHGNLYLHDPTLRYRDSKDGEFKTYGDVCSLSDGGYWYSYPIAKIGSAFWIRKDIGHAMTFVKSPKDPSDTYSTDKILPEKKDLQEGEDQVLYAFLQNDMCYILQITNDSVYGYKPIEATGLEAYNTKWYLPSPEQVKSLYSFIGYNSKALFPSQVSGFNAKFNGYYGTRDILNGNAQFKDDTNIYKVRYKADNNGNTTINVLAAKTPGTRGASSRIDCLMILRDDYDLYLFDDNSTPGDESTYWQSNFYPVRLVRGAHFIYPSRSFWTARNIYKQTY